MVNVPTKFDKRKCYSFNANDSAEVEQVLRTLETDYDDYDTYTIEVSESSISLNLPPEKRGIRTIRRHTPRISFNLYGIGDIETVDANDLVSRIQTALRNRVIEKMLTATE